MFGYTHAYSACDDLCGGLCHPEVSYVAVRHMPDGSVCVRVEIVLTSLAHLMRLSVGCFCQEKAIWKVKMWDAILLLAPSPEWRKPINEVITYLSRYKALKFGIPY